MVSKKEKICYKCGFPIKEKTETYCSLVSYQNGKECNADHWHSHCWKSWNEERMDKKVREYAAQMMSFAVPKVKEAFETGGLIHA